MAVDHIEIHQVTEDQTPLGFSPQLLDHSHAVAVGLRWMRFSNSLSRENVGDLTYANRRNSGFSDGIQHRPRRLVRKIMPIRGSGELAVATCKRPCDDPANVKSVGVPPGNAANFIQPV